MEHRQAQQVALDVYLSIFGHKSKWWWLDHGNFHFSFILRQRRRKGLFGDPPFPLKQPPSADASTTFCTHYNDWFSMAILIYPYQWVTTQQGL